MGFISLFSSPQSSSPEAARADSIRTGVAVPTRSERQRCWAARDVFFACLDAQGIADASQPPGSDAAARQCGPPLAGFERDCAAEWVRYFKQWRAADRRKRETLAELKRQGAVALDIRTDVGGSTMEGASMETAKPGRDSR